MLYILRSGDLGPLIIVISYECHQLSILSDFTI